MCRAFVLLMKQQGAGRIVNIPSQAGITPAPLMVSYNASKAAVVSFSETVHLELADSNIHVSVACPGFFPLI
jgi:short-subunit dehydrogenase